MPDGLRERLREAKLSGLKFGMYGGFAYSFRSNEQAADEALIVVRDWLRELAPDTGHHAFDDLADAIDKELNP